MKISAAEEFDLGDDLALLIKDEVNVKEVSLDNSLEKGVVTLDTNISEELQQEGDFRDLTRFIQTLRKNKKLNPNDRINLLIETDEKGKEIIEKFKSELSELVKADSVELANNDGEVLEIGNVTFKVSF